MSTDLHKALVFALVGLMLVPAGASATEGFSTGKDLQKWCQDMNTDDTAWGLCVGSITAVHDTIMTYQNTGTVKVVVCPPAQSTREDTLKAVLAYIEEEPQGLIYSLGDFVFAALAGKWPCR